MTISVVTIILHEMVSRLVNHESERIQRETVVELNKHITLASAWREW
jgi:hypothetical protein